MIGMSVRRTLSNMVALVVGYILFSKKIRGNEMSMMSYRHPCTVRARTTQRVPLQKRMRQRQSSSTQVQLQMANTSATASLTYHFSLLTSTLYFVFGCDEMVSD